MWEGQFQSSRIISYPYGGIGLTRMAPLLLSDGVQVNNLLTAKISQLETDASLEEEEEKAICAITPLP